MRKIKVFWNVNELAHWKEIFDQQWDCMVKSGLDRAAEEIIIMASGRTQTFLPLINDRTEHDNISLVNVHRDASLHEYPGLACMQKEAVEADEPFDACYIHMKGISRWGNPNVEDWKAWLNWCIIERWQDNVKALETYDTSGPNWDPEPWPHYSSNFWWARSEYIAGLTPLIHPHHKVKTGTTQFKQHPTEKHWRFDHEAWIGSGNPNKFEIARSFDQGDGHYFKPYPRNLYRQD